MTDTQEGKMEEERLEELCKVGDRADMEEVGGNEVVSMVRELLKLRADYVILKARCDALEALLVHVRRSVLLACEPLTKGNDNMVVEGSRVYTALERIDGAVGTKAGGDDGE